MDVNEKIKGGAVWETIDDCDQLSSPETTTSQVHTAASPLLSKSYCYRCLKEIPGSSKYCPWCQIELFVICPKCGNKYSSQYPACNQCGTNRTEYLLVVKKKEEEAAKKRKERKEREDKKRAERQKKEAESRRAREISKRQREAAQTQVSVKHTNSQLAQNEKLTFVDFLPLIVLGLFLLAIICFIMDFFA